MSVAGPECFGMTSRNPIQPTWIFARQSTQLRIVVTSDGLRSIRTSKLIGTIDLMGWPHDFHKAFQEIMRVLKPTGTMLFKWNEDQIPIKDVFKAFGQQPILGDMKSKTKWSVFIKNE